MNPAMGASGALGKLTELKQRILFVLGALIVFRIGTFIPVPGINPEQVARLFEGQENLVKLFSVFTGGALERFSIFALGIMPYISASIIMQLMTAVVPTLEQLKKEGEAGRRKITQYTRYGTVLLALVQAGAVAFGLGGQEGVVIIDKTQFIFLAIISMVTGTVFLMWLGEQMTERGIGNGISIIIFAGIVAGLPSGFAQTYSQLDRGVLTSLEGLFIMAIIIAVTAAVVFVERGQRRITVNYAKRQQGRKMIGGQTSHLPLKVNMAGVIPPIFASAIILFPATIATWFGQSGEAGWLQKAASWLSPGEPFYLIAYAGFIIFFCFFYTAMTMNPKETADNLKKSGAFVPGIRPGDQTARYIDGVMTRLTLWGALYITLVALLPEWMRAKWAVSFYFGGTSLLIIVVVSMDFVQQVQAHLMSRQYESLLKKANLSGGGGFGLPR